MFSQPADARSAGAILGLAAGSDMACLAINTATLQNNCGHTVSLDIPLTVDTAGVKTVTVTAFGATSANNVGCRADATDKTVLTHIFSNGGAYQFLPSFGSRVDINLSGVTVPNAGQLMVNCQVNNGGLVLTENWTQ
jgi:hypothetical protein